MKTTTDRTFPALAIEWSWVKDVIGKPWRFAATGPDAFDCWGLLVFAYKRFGVDLPKIGDVPRLRLQEATDLIRDGIGRDWVQLDAPEPGCGVGLATGRAIFHVGLWTPMLRGSVLHCMQNGATVLQTPVTLRGQGFSNVTFYRYAASRHH